MPKVKIPAHLSGLIRNLPASICNFVEIIHILRQSAPCIRVLHFFMYCVCRRNACRRRFDRVLQSMESRNSLLTFSLPFKLKDGHVALLFCLSGLGPFKPLFLIIICQNVYSDAVEYDNRKDRII